eukprot:2631449-Prymnesium_polylepis.2
MSAGMDRRPSGICAAALSRTDSPLDDIDSDAGPHELVRGREGKVVGSRFGDIVVKTALERSLGVRRTNVYDAAACLHAVEHADQTYLQRVFKVLRIGLQQRVASGSDGVGDEYVDRSQLSLGVIEHALDGTAPRDVGAVQDGSSSHGVDAAGQLLGRSWVADVVDAYIRASVRQFESDASADALAGSGDDSNLAQQW